MGKVPDWWFNFSGNDMWEGSRVLDAHVTAPGGVHVARSDDDD